MKKPYLTFSIILFYWSLFNDLRMHWCIDLSYSTYDMNNHLSFFFSWSVLFTIIILIHLPNRLTICVFRPTIMMSSFYYLSIYLWLCLYKRVSSIASTSCISSVPIYSDIDDVCVHERKSERDKEHANSFVRPSTSCIRHNEQQDTAWFQTMLLNE